MKKVLLFFVSLPLTALQLQAQVEPMAGSWKTWFITSATEFRLPKPVPQANDLEQVLSAQKQLDAASLEQIAFWSAGAPNYRWQELMNKLWLTDTSRQGPRANLLLGTGIYDAMVAAWDTKYAYGRKRPFEKDKRVRLLVLKPESPSYPCEHSVAAGVAVTLINRFYPRLADSVNRMAQRMMQSRIAAGVVYPSDTRAGFELGKRIAEKEISVTENHIYKEQWDGKMPQGPGVWRGAYPMAPVAGLNKPVVLEKASQFRPLPPPDFAKEMEELRSYKQTFRTKANAFYWASQEYWGETMSRKLFEHNLHLNPPRAARVYAAINIAAYDGFIACFDAKYAYWGIRPDQYDTTYKSLVPTPPFPGYPSGHAMMSGMCSELFAWMFPEESSNFRRKAKEAAESRFQAGIHFRSDNEAGLELGRKIAGAMIEKLKADGLNNTQPAASKRAAKSVALNRTD